MVMMRRLDQYLKNRNGHWYYLRRVPEAFAEFDVRTFSKVSLKTASLEVARARRDAMVEADNLYWASLLEHNPAANGFKKSPALQRYRGAKKRALARGYVFTPVAELVDTAGIDEILDRIVEISKHPHTKKGEAEAMLGTAEPAAVPMSEAFEIYCDQIALSDLLGKSDEQKASWKKVKLRAVSNFIAVTGDLPMDKITRRHAQEFREWWGERLKPKGNKRALNPNSANRDIGNMRSLFQAFWDYEGEPDRPNPFNKMRFGGTVYKDIPAFSDDWVRSKILAPGAFKYLNVQAQLIVYALIETGCRPSEIANIQPDCIILDHDVPHLKIRDQKDRKLKSRSSVRDIPLLGVSLAAMKCAPNGFPHYSDKGALLSSALLKAFRMNGLFPTQDHRVYSLRHSLEKRMLEADLDYGLRCLLMGHHDRRPQYGDGGSLEFRRDQMMKIVHPFSPEIFEKLSAT